MENGILSRINSPADVKTLKLEELVLLAQEIRDYIVQVVSSKGGHLAPNLGVVELTIAVHKVFDLDRDKLIFDVSHQCYTHKILTGRKKDFINLRSFGGVSGYCDPNESPYDAFIAGHSSTSLSLALGFVKARELKNESHEIVCIVGDGALTAGEAYEGLNNLGHLGKKVIVLLNDNGMSIGRNVGALARYLYKLRSSKLYLSSLKKASSSALVKKIKLAIKELLLPNVIFEEFGFTYLGPVDGHDLKELIDVLNRSKNINSPVLIHVITKKGKGYMQAEKDPTAFHGTEPFDIETGRTNGRQSKSFSEFFEEALLEEAENNDRLFVISAAMPDGTRTAKFRDKYPDRFLDVGIAESTAVTAAAALAKEGFRPVVAIYSTFMQRAYDQLIHDVAILKLPVIFALDRGGIVSDDGPTHQGIFDIAYMSTIPSFVVSAPKDGNELKALLRLALKEHSPFVIRYPKDTSPDFGEPYLHYSVGKGELVVSGDDLLLVSYGAVFDVACEARNELIKRGFSVGLVNAIFAKPLDEALIYEQAKSSKLVVTIEEGIEFGGFGSILRCKLASTDIKVYSFSLGDFFPAVGKRRYLMELYGISAAKISSFCEGLLSEKKVG